MQVLAGDIGGTKTSVALFRVEHGALELITQTKYPSGEHAGLESIVAHFLQAHEASPAYAAFGIAGPVMGRRVRTTNLPWLVDADVLEARFGLQRVRLLNDLEAMGYGLGELDETDVLVLHRGEGGEGNAALVAAGTGLGEAGLYWDGTGYHPFATEGGHTGFGPEDAEQRALLAFMAERHERVSWERVASGSALRELLEFVEHHYKLRRTEDVATGIRGEDPGTVITEHARGGCTACARTLDLFVRLYGAEAGNFALKVMARGGVYLGGGIAPRIVDKLREPAFFEAFAAKGRMRPLLEAMPVKIVDNPHTPLWGAARRAALEGS